MDKTVRLFDIDAYTREFSATVISCEPSTDGYKAVLDRTAFFPNEGGQACDCGRIGDAMTVSVDERDGVIVHLLNSPVDVGAVVECQVDFSERYRKMQNHTGEHIISGLIYQKFGYSNVGFHLGRDDVTADFDGELSDEDIELIETLANEVVFACRAVRAYYPKHDSLASLEYRSKLALEENVRIVEIEGVDMCACCAPHVSNTGEVGIIKILDHIRYKGGIRIHMQCGFDALDDYRARYAHVRGISMLISAKQDEVTQGVERILDEMGRLKGEISALKRELIACKLATLRHTESSMCLFEDIEDMLSMRNFVNDAVNLTDCVCAVFSGNDADGYKFIIASRNVPLRALLPKLSDGLKAKCGGSDKMVQGTSCATRVEIESFFADFD